MLTLAEIEAKAMELTVSERADLASHLLESLPYPIVDEDDMEFSEILRRECEMETDSSMCISFDELKNTIGR